MTGAVGRRPRRGHPRGAVAHRPGRTRSPCGCGATTAALRAGLDASRRRVPVLGELRPPTTSVRLGAGHPRPRRGSGSPSRTPRRCRCGSRAPTAPTRPARRSAGLALLADSVGVELVWSRRHRSRGPAGRRGPHPRGRAHPTPSTGHGVGPVPLPEIDARRPAASRHPTGTRSSRRWPPSSRASVRRGRRGRRPARLVRQRSAAAPRRRSSGADPVAAIEAWLADLVLDCERVRDGAGAGRRAAQRLHPLAPRWAAGTAATRSAARSRASRAPPASPCGSIPAAPPPARRLRRPVSTRCLGAEPPEPETIAAVLRGRLRCPTWPTCWSAATRSAAGSASSPTGGRGPTGWSAAPGTLPDDVTRGRASRASPTTSWSRFGLTGAAASPRPSTRRPPPWSTSAARRSGRPTVRPAPPST